MKEKLYQIINWGEKKTDNAEETVSILTRNDTDRFSAGIHYEAWQILGAHVGVQNDIKGVHFAVWAPNAKAVSVVGDFNGWDGSVHPMNRLWDSGIFECFVEGDLEGLNYKYELHLEDGLIYQKADPYAFGQQLRSGTHSVIRDISGFEWEDQEWIREREKRNFRQEPMSVYELYPGSFKKPEDGSLYCNYRELAEALIPYVKEMGYTHVELMPVMEHPLDASWGYQIIGYYAPTARYGTPEDFMYFMNEMHKAGIGVILDWVPAHFPRDTHGLYAFDGTFLYEHKDPKQNSNPYWGTLLFNYGRPQVSNYLLANALFWVEQYHADGLRVNAVDSMLYLNYGKKDGEWVANMYGGCENLEAIEFLKHLNSMMHKRNKGVLMIAEDNTGWPMVTGSLDDGGLGFDMKWNNGWAKDFFRYLKKNPYFRSSWHNAITFSMIYAYSEQFMLAISHDEVAHGRGTALGRMPGEAEDKLAGLKAGYGYMMCHPGKKLFFMGQDIGEYEEWNETREVNWKLTENAGHKGLQEFVKAMNFLYRSHPALHELDTDANGFQWIDCLSANDCTLSFLRKTGNENETLLIVLNFANVERPEYKIGVPFNGKYREIINSDEVGFGGKGRINTKELTAVKETYDGWEYSLSIRQAPLCISVFAFEPQDRIYC